MFPDIEITVQDESWCVRACVRAFVRMCVRTRACACNEIQIGADPNHPVQFIEALQQCPNLSIIRLAPVACCMLHVA